MRPLPDDSEFKWIEQGRTEAVGRYGAPHWAGNPVSNVLPAIFDRYVKVLHRLQPHYDMADSPLSSEERLILKVGECDKLRALVEQYRDSKTPRIRWKAIAEYLGLAYSPAINFEWFYSAFEPGCWPRYIYGPADSGGLDVEDYAEIVTAVANSSSADVYMRIAEIAVIGTDTPLLYEASFEELAAFMEGKRNPLFTEYWWPKDRSWCVCSDYDLPYTLIGCEHSTADKLLRSEVLESVEVRPETRIDYRTPIEFVLP